MKTSYFYSPSHPTKICDIAIETIIDTYYKEELDFYSDIFSYIQENTLFLQGKMIVSSPIADVDLLPIIKNNIGTKYEIQNNIIVETSDETFVERTFSGVHLGYSCREVLDKIPFEHQEARKLVKNIDEKLNIPIKVQIHVNGNRLAVSLEHDYDNIEELDNIVKDTFILEESENGTIYYEPEIYHSKLNTETISKSTNSIISTFYGPRGLYSETDYIGSDFLSNKRLGHLICREIANEYCEKNELAYCAVEIDYTSGNPVPIHFGIKGNKDGIHLENGTYFEFGDIENEYPAAKQKVLNKIKSGEINIIEIAKWGFPSTNI